MNSIDSQRSDVTFEIEQEEPDQENLPVKIFNIIRSAPEGSNLRELETDLSVAKRVNKLFFQIKGHVLKGNEDAKLFLDLTYMKFSYKHNDKEQIGDLQAVVENNEEIKTALHELDGIVRKAWGKDLHKSTFDAGRKSSSDALPALQRKGNAALDALANEKFSDSATRALNLLTVPSMKGEVKLTEIEQKAALELLRKAALARIVTIEKIINPFDQLVRKGLDKEREELKTAKVSLGEETKKDKNSEAISKKEEEIKLIEKRIHQLEQLKIDRFALFIATAMAPVVPVITNEKGEVEQVDTFVLKEASSLGEFKEYANQIQSAIQAVIDEKRSSLVKEENNKKSFWEAKAKEIPENKNYSIDAGGLAYAAIKAPCSRILYEDYLTEHHSKRKRDGIEDDLIQLAYGNSQSVKGLLERVEAFCKIDGYKFNLKLMKKHRVDASKAEHFKINEVVFEGELTVENMVSTVNKKCDFEADLSFEEYKK